ncbi:hypothetical protein J6TS2_22980 [Heyndrickxia sporothermodurans]|nr:hypothetical protein J6TS2_22980 [Heyndrickxia sporothermodurans]
MKKIVIVFFLLFLTAFSSKGAIEELKEDYPEEVKKVAESLPVKIQNELAAPKKLPFDIEGVKFSYAGNPPGDPKGEIIHTEFMYAGEEGNLHITTHHAKNISFTPDDKHLKTVDLKDGTKAFIEGESESSKSIRWKKNGRYYSIMLIQDPKIEQKYTIKDLVEIADSMEY